mmetsp:Transcript_40138/g.116057  ORF Transcript_40138/g.116057 Transcript_40138/m.116057 type:complete len:104 (+) Transcript_40138:18-329(+)
MKTQNTHTYPWHQKGQQHPIVTTFSDLHHLPNALWTLNASVSSLIPSMAPRPTHEETTNLSAYSSPLFWIKSLALESSTSPLATRDKRPSWTLAVSRSMGEPY